MITGTECCVRAQTPLKIIPTISLRNTLSVCSLMISFVFFYIFMITGFVIIVYISVHVYVFSVTRRLVAEFSC